MRTIMSSAAIIAVIIAAAAPAAVAQAPRQGEAQQSRFCAMTGTEGQARCGYRSLAQCEHAARGGRCFDRTYMLAATTPRGDAAPVERPVRHRHAVRHHKPMH